MPARKAMVLTRESVAGLMASLPAPKTLRLWDARTEGLVLVADRGKSRAYWAFSYRTQDGRQRQATIGPASMSVAQAREAARLLVGDVARGIDPTGQREAARAAGVTVAEGWRAYEANGRARWKPTTAGTYRDQAARMILPELGESGLAKLTVADAAAWHRLLTERHGKTTANRALALLKAIWNHWAQSEGVAARNPCTGVEMHREHARDRLLTVGELARLWLAVERLEGIGAASSRRREGVSAGRGGKGLREVGPRGLSAHQAALWRLLMVTACRLGEVKGATWEEWRREESVLVLRDSKVGPRRVLVPEVGARIIEGLGPRASGAIILGRDGQAGLNDIRKAWRRVCRDAGVVGAVPHMLRHALATAMIEAGATVLDVSRVLGHVLETRNATSVYLHATEAGARAALEAGVAALMAEVERQRGDSARAEAQLAGVEGEAVAHA